MENCSSSSFFYCKKLFNSIKINLLKKVLKNIDKIKELAYNNNIKRNERLKKY